jgi:hypothetical protein
MDNTQQVSLERVLFTCRPTLCARVGGPGLYTAQKLNLSANFCNR